MTRTLLALLLSSAPALAVGVVAPIPRLPENQLRPMPPATEPDAPKPESEEDPAAVIERITQTAESVGDRLKDKDTGTDTRKQQDQLLKDIDSLLKKNDNPPPMGGDGSDKNNMPPPNGGNGNENMPPSMGGNGEGMPPPNGGGMPPPKGGGGGMPPPKGGNGGSGGRQKQPRGSRAESQPPKEQPQPMGDPGMSEPMPGNPMVKSGNPMTPGPTPKQVGANPGNGNPGGQKSPPALPLDVPITKEVWGQLPEKMRQEVSQYYREQYLPRYNDLLKQYYTALAERERKQQQKK